MVVGKIYQRYLVETLKYIIIGSTDIGPEMAFGVDLRQKVNTVFSDLNPQIATIFLFFNVP